MRARLYEGVLVRRSNGLAGLLFLPLLLLGLDRGFALRLQTRWRRLALAAALASATGHDRILSAGAPPCGNLILPTFEIHVYEGGLVVTGPTSTESGFTQPVELTTNETKLSGWVTLTRSNWWHGPASVVATLQ